MTGHQNEIRTALQRLQATEKFFSIAVYRIDGEYAVRIASAGANCGQCERVNLSGNIGHVARSGLTYVIGDVSKDVSYKSCFPQVRSEIIVPIVISGDTIGVIDAESASGPISRMELEVFATEISALLEAV